MDKDADKDTDTEKTCDERLSLTRTQLNTLFDGASLFKLFDGASLLKFDTCYNWPSLEPTEGILHAPL